MDTLFYTQLITIFGGIITAVVVYGTYKFYQDTKSPKPMATRNK